MAQTDRTAAIARIKTSMIEKKMTQAELADAADCHEKTVQNLLNGRTVRDQTLFDVCMVLGLDFDDLKMMWEEGQISTAAEPLAETSAAIDVAPAYMGAYTKVAVEHYIGSYLTLRPAFRKPNAITAYRTEISWDAATPSLRFAEHDRPDGPFSHQGNIYVPSSSMFIHFVSLTKGAMRSITASQLDQLGQIRGLITTLNKQNAEIIPVSAPIVFLRLNDTETPAFGDISPPDDAFEHYQKSLKDVVADGYVRLITPPSDSTDA